VILCFWYNNLNHVKELDFNKKIIDHYYELFCKKVNLFKSNINNL